MNEQNDEWQARVIHNNPRKVRIAR